VSSCVSNCRSERPMNAGWAKTTLDPVRSRSSAASSVVLRSEMVVDAASTL
jgi:hypothetical protein